MGAKRIIPAVILVTVLAAFANSSECPSKEELRNCECDKKATGGFTVHCYGDRDAGPSDITQCKTMLQEKFPAKAELDLHFENFQVPASLASKVFNGLRVRKLSFVHCRIDRWADKVGGPAFVGLEDSLEELEIQDSLYQRDKYDSPSSKIQPFTLGHIRWLRKVKFYHNRLYIFGEDIFKQGGKAVEELYLDDNEIRKIDTRALSGMTNLRVISLADNQVDWLSSHFASKKIEKINVRNNKFRRFVRNLLDDLPHLKEVDISGNPFMYLSESDWGKVWGQLDSIDVSGTLLHCDNHVDWMVHHSGPGPMLMRGECATPGDVAGMQLKKVIIQKRLNGE